MKSLVGSIDFLYFQNFRSVSPLKNNLVFVSDPQNSHENWTLQISIPSYVNDHIAG